MKPTIHVVAGIIWQDGRYLAVERPEGFPMAGWWEFPGGKIELGESQEDALVRELREELDITATELSFWRELEHEYDRYFVRLYFFHVTGFDGELKCLENQRMEWVDPGEPPVLEFLPADVAVVEALHS
ncbi:NUDIX domain-containing protein [Pseudodesulfovibrio cashew]|uniref:8-oxo-dGTP diphosphatase n=1 Tax=Pseudodesulfovibrio cashew TaxID=2678688 RepID=A0A6I6JJ28_9BACT|nr:(deoxy)nucleoside triphosphate pyrophosphohydrolase [Pseudodesulfovibrio cashew]QGY40958.1 NUDIX domain-containing protein [Pseudodesulfovibrio cashew]